MMYESNLSNLLLQWESSLNSNNSLLDKGTLQQCILDLKNVIDKEHEEEDILMDIKEQKYLNSLSDDELYELFKEQEADMYLSSMENHEQYL